MRRVFVDTGAFVAMRNRAEIEHLAARRTMGALIEAGVGLFTSNYVVAETYTALLVRAGRGEAVAWGTAFRAGRALELVRVDERVEDEAWSIIVAHQDKAWSYVDATSFALMEREGTDEAFAFDRDFTQRGLRVHPRASS
ncbi:MAG: type II toxin-antitoxin system VapC family toxin [Euzebyales bacterium]|nr:type II toxin-antitoxin system VapC family toxin [Euzebyales bacterium]